MPAQPPFLTPTRTRRDRAVGLRHHRLDAFGRGFGEPHHLWSRPGSGHRLILHAPVGMSERVSCNLQQLKNLN